jgi:Tfp pilus assembly protein PilE
MRKRKQGVTLIVLLIVIAIVGTLMTVLFPNLLNALARTFDRTAHACLKEVSMQEEAIASESPFLYHSTLTAAALPASSACRDAAVKLAAVEGTAPAAGVPAATTFTYTAYHASGNSLYKVAAGTGVTRAGPRP